MRRAAHEDDEGDTSAAIQDGRADGGHEEHGRAERPRRGRGDEGHEEKNMLRGRGEFEMAALMRAMRSMAMRSIEFRDELPLPLHFPRQNAETFAGHC